MKDTLYRIFLIALPVLIMIALIPLVRNDFTLALIFAAFSVIAFLIKYNRNDAIFFLFGLIVVTAFEYLFIMTGIETFESRTLFDAMPLWLPLLWGYSFVEIRRATVVLESFVSSRKKSTKH